MRYPSILEDFNAFINDNSYAGEVKKAKLPDVSLKTESFRPGGIGMEIEQATGLEKMDVELEMATYDKRILGLVGKRTSRDTPLVLRGGVTSDGELKTVVVKMQGLWKKYEGGDWEAAKEGVTKFSVNLDHYELEIDGEEIYYIDAKTKVFRVNGEDQYEQLRQALQI